jgi:hypothetical protein
MSEENVEVVLQGVEALNRRDVDGFIGLVSPDVEWEDSVFWSEHARIHRAKRSSESGSTRSSWNPGKAFSLRSRRSPKLRMIGFSSGGLLTTRGKGSGVETQVRGWSVVWITNGKTTRRQVFLDRDEALEAAGLRE